MALFSQDVARYLLYASWTKASRVANWDNVEKWRRYSMRGGGRESKWSGSDEYWAQLWGKKNDGTKPEEQ